jgi:hypothetical protein
LKNLQSREFKFVIFFTFLTQLAAAGQVGAMQSGSHTKGNWSLAQDVCVRALELSLPLEALKAKQRSLLAFAAGFKNDLMRSGRSFVF